MDVYELNNLGLNLGDPIEYSCVDDLLGREIIHIGYFGGYVPKKGEGTTYPDSIDISSDRKPRGNPSLAGIRMPLEKISKIRRLFRE